MKKKILLFTTRAVTSKFNKSLVEQMAILKEHMPNYDIVLLTRMLTDKDVRAIESISGIKISEVIRFRDHYFKYVNDRPYTSWMHYLENETLLDRDDIAHAVVFGSMLSSACGMTRAQNNYNRFLTTQQQTKFCANGLPMTGQLQIVKYCNEHNIPYHEVCYDPCENSIAQTVISPPVTMVYHGYKTKNYTRLDSLQAFLANQPRPTCDKTVDLLFGFTVLTRPREQQYDRIMDSLVRTPVNATFFIKHKYKDLDTFVDRDTYLTGLAKSRFTLVIPSYDPTHFSPYRFIEAIHNNCLPLVMEDVVSDEFMTSYGIPHRLVMEITCSYRQIGDVIEKFGEQHRKDLLEELAHHVLPVRAGLSIE